ncbi:MAG: hypothetical protein RSC93_02440 [Erysipelotrichaceae bacterium]
MNHQKIVSSHKRYCVDSIARLEDNSYLVKLEEMKTGIKREYVASSIYFHEGDVVFFLEDGVVSIDKEMTQQRIEEMKRLFENTKED